MERINQNKENVVVPLGRVWNVPNVETKGIPKGYQLVTHEYEILNKGISCYVGECALQRISASDQARGSALRNRNDHSSLKSPKTISVTASHTNFVSEYQISLYFYSNPKPTLIEFNPLLYKLILVKFRKNVFNTNSKSFFIY